MIKKYKLFICIIMIFAAFSAYADTSPAAVFEAKLKKARTEVKELQPKDMMDWIKHKKKFVLIDVREHNEVEAGKIEAPNTMHIPRGILDVIASKGALRTDQTLVVYCKTGSRGELAAAMLQHMGFKYVYNLAGGIQSWMKDGLPITNSLGTFKAVPFELTGCGEEEY